MTGKKGKGGEIVRERGIEEGKQREKCSLVCVWVTLEGVGETMCPAERTNKQMQNPMCCHTAGVRSFKIEQTWTKVAGRYEC